MTKRRTKETRKVRGVGWVTEEGTEFSMADVQTSYYDCPARGQKLAGVRQAPADAPLTGAHSAALLPTKSRHLAVAPLPVRVVSVHSPTYLVQIFRAAPSRLMLTLTRPQVGVLLRSLCGE